MTIRTIFMPCERHDIDGGLAGSNHGRHLQKHLTRVTLALIAGVHDAARGLKGVPGGAHDALAAARGMMPREEISGVREAAILEQELPRIVMELEATIVQLPRHLQGGVVSTRDMDHHTIHDDS